MAMPALFVGGPVDGRRMLVEDDAPKWLRVEAMPTPKFALDARALAPMTKIETVEYRRQEVRHDYGATAMWLYVHPDINDALMHIISRYPKEKV